jgi:hydroxyacylglutathione hydrolase
MSGNSETTCTLTVAQIPCLSDNYGYLIHDEATGQTAAIDTPEAGPYQRELLKRGWTLTHIFNTHHHWDHTGANMELKATGDVKIVGPASEKIPGIDLKLKDGDEIEFGRTKAKIIDVGGHTKGHIAYYFEDDAKVFVGDSLFALVSCSASVATNDGLMDRNGVLTRWLFVLSLPTAKGLW